MCQQHDASKRNFLKCSAGVAALAGIGAMPSISYAASLTKEERDKMTPSQILNSLIEGNQRFMQGKVLNHDYIAQKKTSQFGQYPSAIILSCIDSRTPAEIILDTGIGELFNARVAGNVSNHDILGSLEYACAIAGAKVVMVMGHTRCGAVKGAIADVKLDNLTGLLDQIKPAIAITKYAGERSANNYKFVDAVAKNNVALTIDKIRKNSKVLRDLEWKSNIIIAGSMYDLSNGKVTLI